MAQIFSLKNSKFFSGLKKICARVPTITTNSSIFFRGYMLSSLTVKISYIMLAIICVSYILLLTCVHFTAKNTTPGLEVIKLEFILKLKIKPNEWLLADTYPQAANHCTLFSV